MSRALIGLPKNSVQRKEQTTIEVVGILRSKGFVEKPYLKPYRIFTSTKNVVKFSVRDGVALVGDKKFSGDRYGEPLLTAVNELADANNN